MEKQYPRIMYHPDESPDGLIVKTAEHEAALGAGWGESPAEAFDKCKALNGLKDDAAESHESAEKSVPPVGRRKPGRKPKDDAAQVMQ